jgi:hypothetical protein
MHAQVRRMAQHWSSSFVLARVTERMDGPDRRPQLRTTRNFHYLGLSGSGLSSAGHFEEFICHVGGQFRKDRDGLKCFPAAQTALGFIFTKGSDFGSSVREIGH